MPTSLSADVPVSRSVLRPLTPIVQPAPATLAAVRAGFVIASQISSALALMNTW